MRLSSPLPQIAVAPSFPWERSFPEKQKAYVLSILIITYLYFLLFRRPTTSSKFEHHTSRHSHSALCLFIYDCCASSSRQVDKPECGK